VRDRRFADAFDDIVVEFGNAKYQEVIDRFVRGEDVPYDVLRQVWQNTTQPIHIWDLPVYEEFFRIVRAVNASMKATSACELSARAGSGSSFPVRVVSRLGERVSRRVPLSDAE